MATHPGDTIPPILSAAKRLRQVRATQREFLLRWAQQKRRTTLADSLTARGAMTDPLNADRSGPLAPLNGNGRDWSMLYRGSVLDD